MLREYLGPGQVLRVVCERIEGWLLIDKNLLIKDPLFSVIEQTNRDLVVPLLL